MEELLRTNNAVTLSFAEACLSGEGIAPFVADRHISMIEGSIGAFPRRLMVAADDLVRARRVMREAGLAAELTTDR